MIIITGGAGFIGSNLINKLNNHNNKIIISESFLQKKSKQNLKNLKYIDVLDPKELLKFLKKNKVESIFHLGAITDTQYKNRRKIIQNNFNYSKKLFKIASNNNINFIYASSASVYGNSINNRYKPLNIYAESKLLFDKFVIKNITKVNNLNVGLRFFNVYGKNEMHKDKMASMPTQLINSILKKNKCRLFKGYFGYKDGDQKRDFVSVDTCIDIMLYLEKKRINGIFDVGSGTSISFNQIAREIIKINKGGTIEYFEMPLELRKKYQNFTQANIDKKLKVKFIKYWKFKDKVSELYKFYSSI